MSIISEMLIIDMLFGIAVLGLCFGLFWLAKLSVELKHWPKWCYVGCAIVSIVITFIAWKEPISICLDMAAEDYIIYQGDYTERGPLSEGLVSVVFVYDENGDEIRLTRTGAYQKGECNGVVVYGKRSKVIVEYSGTPKTEY